MDTQFKFNKLDAQTRAIMVEEIQRAASSGNIYFSKRFTEVGARDWVPLLTSAATQYDEHWLACQLDQVGAMKELELKAKPSGGATVAHVSERASETLASGQFNRFYMAAICNRVIQEGKEEVVVYRAIHRGESRSESVALEGTSRDAAGLLEELRIQGASLKCDLLKPNSGLSVDY